MDEQQSRRINEAAQQFAEVLMKSYRAATDRTVSAQELNAELTRNFFDGVINNLRARAESNREMIRELADQQQRQQEAAQSLARESVNAYMEFLDSMFFFYRRSVEEAERGAREAENGTSEYFRNIIGETNRRSAGEA